MSWLAELGSWNSSPTTTGFISTFISAERSLTAPVILVCEVDETTLTDEGVAEGAMAPLVTINLGFALGTVPPATENRTGPTNDVFGMAARAFDFIAAEMAAEMAAAVAVKVLPLSSTRE